MSNVIIDAIKASERLAKQLQTDELYAIVTVDASSYELVNLDFQNAFAICSRSIDVSTLSLGKIEAFLEKMERELFCKTNATNLADFYHDFDNYIDTLRDEEGRVFL